ncbi:cytochrome P450 oxidoreductase [Lepidopterella palustris CBS 459.81]|uniref:Cytochrome P450 oxidoreductase n=1 Tax=Lepidopterella palustris CBS 459.81 TaxID=1314670 RepID=A0A8E2J8L6_9PEZI|nr:cytochrome P450 oxidoreductase [Lepidopterella palustris CBS 459.81]
MTTAFLALSSWSRAFCLYVLLTVLLLRLIYLRYRNNLNAFPGPVVASVTDLWRLWYSYHNKNGIPMVKLHEEYGPVIRIGPRMLSFSTPEAVRDIYGPGKNFKKSEFYSVIAPLQNGVIKDTLFSTRDQAYHSGYRRAVNSSFSMSVILQYESYLDETTQIFLNKIDEIITQTKGKKGLIDLPRLLQYYAFDAVAMLAYSKRYGFVEKNTDIDGIMKTTRFILDYTSHMGNYPLWDKIFLKNPLMRLLGRLGFINMTTPMIPFAINSQAERLREFKANPNRKEKNRDILDSYMALHIAKPDIVTENEVLELGVMLGFAGSESTGVALSALIYYVVRDARVYGKLQSELNSHLATSVTGVTYAETQTLPYFDACVKETFRIHPPSGFIMERVTPPSGAQIAGYTVPGNTIVGCNPWAVHRDKATFGEDVEVFRPERWLEPSEDEVRKIWKSMIHFGAGPHTCMGRHVSVLEIYKLGATILRHFKITLTEQDRVYKLTVGQFVRLDFSVMLERVEGL